MVVVVLVVVGIASGCGEFDGDIYDIKENEVRSTVRLRFRKSVSGHHFQTIRKLANTDLQYHRGVMYSIYQYILTKKCVFSS